MTSSAPFNLSESTKEGPSCDLALLDLGLNRRIQAAEILRKMHDGSKLKASTGRPPGDVTSLFAAALSRQRVFAGRRIPPQTELLSYLINTSCERRTVTQQVDYIHQIATQNERHAVMPFAVGCLLSSDDQALASSRSLGAEDYSIAIQSSLFANQGNEAGEERLLVTRRIAQLRRILSFDSAESFFGIKTFLQQLGFPLTVDSLVDFRRCLSQAKRAWWPILGADIFSFLQALIDPSQQLTLSQLECMSRVFKVWNVGPFASQLIVLRAASNFSSDREFVKLNWPGIRRHLHPRLVRSVEQAVIEDKPLDHTTFRPRDFIGRCVAIALSVDRAVRRRSGGDLKYSIVSMYQHDPVTIGYLDWVRIRSVLNSTWLPPDDHTAFLMLLMGEPQVRERFRMVAFSMGRGAFISDLHVLIKGPTRRTPTIYNVVAKFRKLPSKARDRVILELLQKSVIERLANMLATSPSFTGPLTSQIDTKVCALRMDAVRAAYVVGAIDLETFEHIRDDAINQLRVLLFRNILLDGRVQVEWESLQAEAAARFREEFDFLSLQDLAGAKVTVPQATLEAIMQYVASLLTRFVLIESLASVDQAISNNLRHGILLPRFMRAFQDAIPPLEWDGKVVRDWSDEAIVDHYGEAGDAIVTLRNDVAKEINEFMDEYLKITPTSEIVKDTTSEATRVLKASIVGRRRPVASLVMFMPAFKRQTEKFILMASAALNDLAWPNIASCIRQMREMCRTSESQQLLDSIETNLGEALHESSRWINIAVDRGHVKEFTIDEIVSVELLSTQASHSERLKVSCRSTDHRTSKQKSPEGGPLSIDGRFLPFFQEALHNLVSNAFKHSGYGLQTILEIELLATDDGFTLRASNSMTAAQMKAAIDGYSGISKLASVRPAKRQKLDKSSGFQRIKVVGGRAFKSNVRINVPPLSSRRARFMVEVIVSTSQSLVVK
ncbi:hypothetical protein ACVINW_003727 [Bradyrhizobium sp. USDA 4461]